MRSSAEGGRGTGHRRAQDSVRGALLRVPLPTLSSEGGGRSAAALTDRVRRSRACTAPCTRRAPTASGCWSGTTADRRRPGLRPGVLRDGHRRSGALDGLRVGQVAWEAGAVGGRPPLQALTNDCDGGNHAGFPDLRLGQLGAARVPSSAGSGLSPPRRLISAPGPCGQRGSVVRVPLSEATPRASLSKWRPTSEDVERAGGVRATILGGQVGWGWGEVVVVCGGVLRHCSVDMSHLTASRLHRTKSTDSATLLCSQTRTTFQPASASRVSVSRSLRTLCASFSLHQAELAFGEVPWIGHECQKQPSTNTARRLEGNATSIRLLLLPGTGYWIRYR